MTPLWALLQESRLLVPAAPPVLARRIAERYSASRGHFAAAHTAAPLTAVRRFALQELGAGGSGGN